MTEEALRKNEASLIFKPLALATLLICLLTSIWFQLYTVIGVLSFILVLVAFIYVWNKMAVQHINVTLELPISRVFTGDTFYVQATVKNDKWIPLVWLDIELNESSLVSWQEKPLYIGRLMWLLAYQEVALKVKGDTQHRGVYDIGNLIITSGDGFRFMETEKKYNLHRKIYIYPKLVPVNVPLFNPAMQWEVRGDSGGLLEDPLMVSGVREYEPGDDWKRFNWWASARTGDMQTNVYERIVTKELTIFVDVQGFVIEEVLLSDEAQQKYVRKMKQDFEAYLSIIASFAIAYHEQGIHVGFSTNALTNKGDMFQTLRPKREITRLLDNLAQMTQHATSGISLLNEKSSSPLFVFCESLTKKHLSLYEKDRQTRDVYFYYTNKNEEAKQLHNVASPIVNLLVNGEAV